MKPSAGKRFLCRRSVLEIAFHHHIAAKHDLAHGLAVARKRCQRVGIAHVERLERDVAHALARLLGRLLRRGQRVPCAVPFIGGGGPVGFGEAVDVRDVEAGLLHCRQHGLRRRCGSGEELDHMRQRLLLGRGRIEQGRHHDRRTAEMGHAMVGDGVVHRRRAHLAQADMGAGHHRDGPWEAPAIAMKHRQRPEIDAVLAHAAGEHVADGEQVGAAVVINDALGISGGARSVVERDRVPLIVRPVPVEAWIAGGDELLVFERAQPLARSVELGIVVVDDQRLHPGERERLLRQARELPVGDQHLGLRVIELECDQRGIETGVDGVEHCLGHRHAVVAFEHRRRVGEQDRDGIAAGNALRCQRRSKLPRAGVELGVAPAQPAVNDGGVIGEDGSRPLQERQRGERLEVRSVPVEIDVVRALGQAAVILMSPTTRFPFSAPAVGEGT